MLLALVLSDESLYDCEMNKNLRGTKMKTIVRIVLVSAALLSVPAMAQSWTCDYVLPQCPDKLNKLESAVGAAHEQMEQNKITRVEMSKKILEITKEMYPKDGTMISLAEQRLAINQLLADSSTSPEMAEKMRKVSSDFYTRVISDRFEMANSISKIEGQQQASRQPGNSAANTAAVATMLSGIGRAFNNSYGQSITPPPQICNYYGGTRYCF